MQSKYQSADDVPLSELGWIVPVPTVPEVGTMSPDAAHQVFSRLFRTTRIEPVSSEDSWLILIAKRWVFVTARVTAGAERTEVLGSSGMLAPLVLVFPARQAIYPLALTATGGQETEIDLYVYHSGKMDAGGRLTIEYADRFDESVSWIADSIEPSDLLVRGSLTENFITHLHGRMTPEQMKDDLVLGQAPDNAHLHSSWAAGLWSH